MADTRSPDGLARAGGPRATSSSRTRRRRGLRITLGTLASVAVMAGALLAGGYAYVNHELGSIRRIPVGFLAPHDSSRGQTILLTSSPVGPAGANSRAQNSGQPGLIMLLHVNADGTTGGVVSIPPDTVVDLPGRGRTQLMSAAAAGGASLLTQAVRQLAGLPISHYAWIEFDQLAALIDAVGGVQVTRPPATAGRGPGPRGVRQLNGTGALQYARDPSLSPAGRRLRQQSLIRAVLGQLATERLLTRPLAMGRVLTALPATLTVDRAFSNADLERLATELGRLSGSAATFVTAPTMLADGARVISPGVSARLWAAISNGTLASFAREFPATVTPEAAP
jgi:LCP family protein required for cell wall assembly